MKPSKMRAAAVAIALLWSCWWIFFATASSWNEGGTKAIGIGLLVSVGLLGSAAVACKWEPIGGTLLILEGLTVVSAYVAGFLHNSSAATMLFVLMTAAVPPILAGILFHLSWLRSRFAGGSSL